MSASRRLVFGLTGCSPNHLHSVQVFSHYFHCCAAHVSGDSLFRFSTLTSATMPPNKRRGAHNNQRWSVKPDMGSSIIKETAKSPQPVTSTSGASAITEASHKIHNNIPSSRIQPVNLREQNEASLQRGKSIWAPKSYGTVTSNPASEVENIKGDASQNSNASLSRLFRDKHLENFNVDNSTYTLAQIRATFYPKFENEKSDQEVRTRMIEMVSRGLATLEVSLKHSGSLFMYAGPNCGAYAKNSYGNIYTAVGVYVLARTFRQEWGSKAFEKQTEFNDFIETNRMCISMELVTAVLGDHGQRPREDYVVVTAVSELGNGKPKFYSTPEIIAFCRGWRLPTNHVWLFSTRKSATSFFAAFDALCEEGTATPVCRSLDEVADISVPGSKDHVKVQGEILEGLVARIVTRESSEHMLKVLNASFPPPLNGEDIDLGLDVREICAANRTDEKEQIKALLKNIGPSFCPNFLDWFGSEGSDLYRRNADRSAVSKFLQAHPRDFQTRKIQEMVRLMTEKRFPAAFKCSYNLHKMDSLSGKNIDFRMVIHVHSDSGFRRYQKEMRYDTGLWPLYRGFFVDVNLFKAAKESTPITTGSFNGSSSGTSGQDALADEDANLMIKLKFLTYKLRTFLIRNGLSTLFKDGPGAYKSYYLRQMKIWSTSSAKQRGLSKMLDEWAVYIRRKCGNRQLSSSVYLSEAEPFLEQYAKRSPENQGLVGSAGNIVRTENFLALIEPGGDEEGDLDRDHDAKTTPAKDIISKTERMIVFFPGIPGCAKSALCREIMSTSGGLGDDRTVTSLMGDLIKGRYWQMVANESRKKPSSILLADKNAPNEEVWRQIEEMCRSTNASAVPVIPDSEGTVSNPFSLHALAVFLFRVLRRVNHPGNLDSASPNAGFVLLMFYHLYEGKSRNEFENELIERFGSVVKMPLLKPDRDPLPDAVTSVLEDGISLYGLHTRRHRKLDSTKGSYAPDWTRWEVKLRDVLFRNADHLDSVQVPFGSAVQHVLDQLRSAVGVPRTGSDKRKFGTIVFAAVNLHPPDVDRVLDSLAAANAAAAAATTGFRKAVIERAHITLAHKRSHGVTAVAQYGQFLHRDVPVTLTALVFSERAAAFEVELGSVDGESIVSLNEWPHVTVWTAPGVAPKEANSLPQQLLQGKATRIALTHPAALDGTVEFY